MADIHQLRQPAPRIWICDCGCSTFELLSNGTARCAACDADHEGVGSGWLDRSEDRRSPHAEKETFADVQGNGSVEFARRRVAQMASDENAVLLVVAREDGSLSAWSKAERAEQFAWAEEKLKQATALVTRKAEDLLGSSEAK